MISAKLLLAYLLQSADISGMVDPATIDTEQAYCLAENIYYESKNEDIQGQIAVASVTLNRVNDPRFPDTVCDVVKFTAPSKITKKPVCAFSWYCEPAKGTRDLILKNDRNREQFETAAMIAIKMMLGIITDNTSGATHFHNPFTSDPQWKYQYKKIMRIGNHDFYKKP